MVKGRCEPRLNDPADSSIDRKLSETITPDTQGRVLTDGKLFAQVALPRIDNRPETGDLGPALERAARTIRASWHGELAPPVRLLPTRLPAAKLPSPATEPAAIPVGVDQESLAPVLLDLFGMDQHLLILGDNECGKTNLLKLIATQLVERYGDK